VLAAGVMAVVFIGGAMYLSYAVSGKNLGHWSSAWLLFSIAYAINYYFGANNSILLALAKVETFNYIGSLTRALNFFGTLLLLIAGLSVMGICISFAASVTVGCLLTAIAARRSLLQFASAADADPSEGRISEPTKSTDIVKYTLFTFSAFALYKGGVLVATSFFPKDLVGRYSLTLQAYTMLSAAALVPIQIWLARLVNAIVVDDQKKVVRELARTFWYANLVFAAGTAFLVLLGNEVLGRIGTKVTLPGAANVLIVAFAFLVELNIFILVNLLVTKRRYEFVRIYVVCAASGMMLGLSAIWLTRDLVLSMIVIPAIVQAMVCLPLLTKRVCAELKTTPGAFIAMLGQGILARN
jgi:hypothetical protein